MLLMNPATVCCHKASFPFLPFSKTFAVSTSSFCPPVCQSLLSWRIHSISRIVNPNSNKFRVKCSSHEPLKVIISRDPSSGEDSLCRKIANKYELVHISTEDLLKDEVFLGTDIGIKVKECMEKGLSIPNNLIREVVTSRTSKQDTKEKGWLLVGHPENSSLEQRPDIYILLDVESGQEMYRPDNDVQDSYLDVLYKIDEDRSTEELFREIDSLLLQVQTNKLKTTKFQRKVVPAFNSASRSQDSNRRGIPTLLNNVPHSRDIRKYFYDDILQSTQRALEAGMIRLKVENNIPELNPEMDVYRIGTLMELVRSLALSFADDGKRVKVCVQGYMGDGALAGMPLQLAGSRKILEFMDWGNYGAKGTFINIGSIGARDVTDEDDIFILVAPQNAVGNCIIDDLQAMTNAARNRPVILVNPRLKDLPSSNGIMQAMGREKRLEYAASFQECYFFRLLYYAGTQYPIMGALRMSYPYPYELFKRVDDPSVKEKYVLLSTFSEKPTPSEINDAFEGRTRTKSERKTSIWSFLSGIL